jgi:glycosyltransferase involved in cell wall biosynthesis
VTTIVHFERKPGPRSFSIERLFADLRGAMPPDISCLRHVSPFFSQGIVPRARNILDARRHQGQINHVTGDVHFLALGLPRSKTILTVHDCGMLHRLRGWRRSLLKFCWFTWPILHCRVVTAVSEATRRDLIEIAGAPPGKIRVIHDCVSPRFIAEVSSFNASRPRVLLIGTAPNKNLERMAKALTGLPCDVEIVGAPSPGQLAEFERQRVRLTVLGDLDENGIHAAYRRCDLVLFASTHEGFGLPILEAQAIGRPVITGDCSSMPEVAGDAACLIDPFDPSSIRLGLERVIGDPAFRENLIRSGFENTRRFPAARIAEQYAGIYREVAMGAARA